MPKQDDDLRIRAFNTLQTTVETVGQSYDPTDLATLADSLDAARLILLTRNNHTDRETELFQVGMGAYAARLIGAMLGAIDDLVILDTAPFRELMEELLELDDDPDAWQTASEEPHLYRHDSEDAAAKQAAQRDAEVRASGVEQAIEDIANEEAYAAQEAEAEDKDWSQVTEHAWQHPSLGCVIQFEAVPHDPKGGGYRGYPYGLSEAASSGEVMRTPFYDTPDQAADQTVAWRYQLDLANPSAPA